MFVAKYAHNCYFVNKGKTKAFSCVLGSQQLKHFYSRLCLIEQNMTDNLTMPCGLYVSAFQYYVVVSLFDCLFIIIIIIIYFNTRDETLDVRDQRSREESMNNRS